MKHIICIAILALSSLGSPAAEPQAAHSQATLPRVMQSPVQVAVRDAWIRWLPAGVPGAGFMTVTNVGPVTQYLVGASSADFGPITLHQTRAVQGLRGMMPVDSLALAPNTTVKFAESGYHWMLPPGLRNVHPGETVSITLHFAGGGLMSVPFEIRAER